jgi:hypothetical protein
MKTTVRPLTQNLPITTAAARWKTRVLKFFVGLVIVGLSLALWPETASACRDCPFPIRLAEGIYEMPGGDAQIWMETRRMPNGSAETWVALVDAKTGYTLAEGWVRHAFTDRRVSLNLDDFMGGGVRLEVFWQDLWREHIRVRMACMAPRCNVQQKYMR